jgi:hypothetical protein
VTSAQRQLHRIWKERLNAKTLVTTPNSDVIYAMVIEAPPGMQGILDDFFFVTGRTDPDRR